jgi:hypothetical protein
MSDQQVQGVEGVERPSGEENGSETPFNWSEMTTQEQLEFFESQQLSKFEKVSFDDALKVATVAKPELEVASKRNLIGVPFVIRQIKLHYGQFGAFVSLIAVTKRDDQIVINDGSTGIARQCVDLVKTYGTDSPVLIQGGLKESVYYIDRDTRQFVSKNPGVENTIPASTFYLDFQPA